MTPPGRRSAPLALVSLLVWTTFLAVAALGLHRMGGALAAPPLAEPGQLGGWLRDREPAGAAMAVVRLVGLATAWYLLAATVASTLARVAGIASWVRATDALSVPLVRRLVHSALGLSFATAALAGAGSAAVADEQTAPAPVAAVTMRQLPDATVPGSVTTAGAAAAVPTMRRLDDTTTTTTTPPVETTAPPPTAPAPWEIQPGEHFWSVAERVLTSAWGRAPSESEVDPYWRTLVGANTEVLRDRGNPDLLFPGQVITLPPPPAAPTSS